jgi:hypothetical protein
MPCPSLISKGSHIAAVQLRRAVLLSSPRRWKYSWGPVETTTMGRGCCLLGQPSDAERRSISSINRAGCPVVYPGSALQIIFSFEPSSDLLDHFTTIGIVY